MAPGMALTSRLAVAAVAGCGLAWPRDYGRWLPVRLPDFVSNANVRTTGILLAGSARSERGSRPLPKHPRALRAGMRLIRDNTRNAANPSSFR